MYSSLHHQGLRPAAERGIKYQQNLVRVRMWNVPVENGWEYVLILHGKCL